MAVRRRPPNARSSGLRPLKWFNLAPQPSTASCHQMPLPISAVHHLPPLQSRSGAPAGVSMPLRDATPRPSVQQPHLGARRRRQQIPCAAGAGACSRAASLGVSLWSCKNFIVKVRPRLFSGLASPLLPFCLHSNFCPAQKGETVPSLFDFCSPRSREYIWLCDRANYLH